MSVNVDDTDSSIRYSGDWDEIVGSTRQWGAGTVHSTSQHGASATITFTGTRIVMYCTLFHGTGNEIANIDFDGTTTTVSKPSQSEDVYNDVWFDSGEVLGVQHTLVVSNGGGSSDTPLQLDQFFIEGTVDAPSAPPPPPPPPPTSTPNQVEQKTATTTQITTAIVTANSGQSSSGFGSSSSEPRSSTSGFNTRSSSTSATSPTSTITSGGSTVLSIQYIPTTSVDGSLSQTANTSDNPAFSSASKKVNTGGIIGGIVGAVGLLSFMLLLLFLLRRRRKARQRILLTEDAEKARGRPRNPTAVTPFRIEAHSNSEQPLTPGAVSHQGLFQSKRSPPMSEGQGVVSPISATSSTGIYTASDASGGRRSTEKSPGNYSDDTHQPFSPFIGLPLTASNAIPRSPFYQPGDMHVRSEFASPHGLHHLPDGTVVGLTLGSIHAAIQGGDDIRPPSYHRAVRS